MVREIVHDPILLSIKSAPATKEDLPAAKDLLDTLVANKEACVGMAANMVGIHKRIIVFDNGGTYMTMFNPEILRSAEPYDARESCLSLLGGPCCGEKPHGGTVWHPAKTQTPVCLTH